MSTRMVLFCLTCVPLMAAAESFDYTYIEAGYVSTELDVGPLDVDGNGLGVRGSYAFNDSWYGFAGIADQEFDFDVDGTQFNAGVGWHNALSDTVDLLAEASWVSVELDSGFASADEDGFGLGLGVRAHAWENVQLEAGINYVDLDDSDTSLDVAGRYYLTQAVAVGLGLTFSDDATGWNLGFRAEF